MRRLAIISALIVGVVIGLLSVAVIGKFVMSTSNVKNGSWGYNPYVGSDEAGGYTRATIAIVGFLAMTKKESMYFIARADSNDDMLVGSCVYKVEGKITPDDARWWSITVYNAVTSKLIANELDHYSYNGDNIKLDEDGSFSFWVSATKQEGNWIPVQEDKIFDLTLRLYNPSEAARNDTKSLVMPTITKEYCS